VEKSAYLDAMGISRWSQGSEVKQAYVILVDKVSLELETHPIISTVLSLIECPFTHCTFTTASPKGSEVIWDMRRVKVPRANATLTSAPLSELEKVADNKRELWNMIVAQQELSK